MIMVFVMCIKSFTGQILFSLAPILFLANLESSIYTFFVLFANFLYILSSGLNFFIYIIFNKSFRAAVFKIFNPKRKYESKLKDGTSVRTITKTKA